MFCRKKDYLKIEKIQYKALKIILNNIASDGKLLIHNNEVSINQKYLRVLATKKI